MTLGVGVLASGEGTNLQAILDRVPEWENVDVVAVGSNRDDARALHRGRAAGVATASFPLAAHGDDRAARDTAMAEWLQSQGVQLVVLAGYMQLVTPGFLSRFPDAVINVHPALLPAFPGVRAVEQALDYGVKVTGVTVHFVDEGVDTGPIIFQQAVPVPTGADAQTLQQALRPVEHELLCRAVEGIASRWVARDPDHPRRVLVSR